MLKITKDNIPSLRAKCKEVEMPLSKEDKETLDQMLLHLKESQDPSFREKHPSIREGVGLAAPQVGINKRMLVVHYPIGDNEFISYQLVNPKIISNSIKEAYLSGGEGCLSVDAPHPGYVYRYYKITVKAYDALVGENVTIKAEGYDAIVLQHEIDHLDGILFYDRINKNNPYQQKIGAVAI